MFRGVKERLGPLTKDFCLLLKLRHRKSQPASQTFVRQRHCCILAEGRSFNDNRNLHVTALEAVDWSLRAFAESSFPLFQNKEIAGSLSSLIRLGP